MNIKKRGEMGIGTLILFIAFILVAAVAASVLVSTTGSLQSKALVTGKATQAEIGTSMTAIEIYSEDGTDNSVDYFFETIKLSSGSDPLKFSDILLTMNTNNVSGEYSYNSNHTAANCSDSATLGAGEFGVSYSLRSDDFTDGYIFPGDVVRICFKSPRVINEAESIKVSIVPKIGASLAVETNMPSLIKDKRIYVFP